MAPSPLKSIDWFAPPGTKVRKAYEDLVRAAAEIETLAKPYRHRVIASEQLHDSVRRFLEEGLDGGYKLRSDVRLSEEQRLRARRVIALDHADTVLFPAYLAARVTLAAHASLAVSLRSLQEGSVLPAFGGFRAVVEQVAHASRALNDPLLAIDSSQTAVELEKRLIQIKHHLASATYGTRIAWDTVIMGADSIRDSRDKKLDYKVREGRVDLGAKRIGKAIKNLAPTIKGIERIYDVLCEFAHPNFGSHLAFSQGIGEEPPDVNGIRWRWFDMGLSPPVAFAKTAAEANAEILECLTECVRHQVSLHNETARIGARLTECLRKIIAHMASRERNLFEPYQLCPCRSGKKYRYCCGSPRERDAESES